MNLSESIYKRLQDTFSPSHLEVIDDGHKHIGHVGSQNGAGHFTIKIQADCFSNQSRLTAHRTVYQVLADLIPEKIHALQIKFI
jgi:BolA protein